MPDRVGYQQRREQRERRRHIPQPDRCRPLLHATFRDGDLVQLLHRHINGVCVGPCVGGVDTLPLDYLYREDRP